MSKFREKYALHNKYRMSASQTRQSDASTASLSTISENEKNGMPRGEKTKVYASSSATLSTASLSIDSSDTPIRASDSGTNRNRNGHADGKSHSYQQLGSKNASSRQKSSYQHEHGYQVLPPFHKDAQSDSLTAHNNNDETTGIASRAMPILRKTNSQLLERQEHKSSTGSSQNTPLRSSNHSNPAPQHERHRIKLTQQSVQEDEEIASNDELQALEAMKNRRQNDRIEAKHSSKVPMNSTSAQRANSAGEAAPVSTRSNRIETQNSSKVPTNSTPLRQLNAAGREAPPVSTDSNQIESQNSSKVPTISTPARRMKAAGHESTFYSTPPRVAQTHGYFHMVPTEAQLRWAQFHQRKRAALTQKRVEKLMQTPLYVQLVERAKNGDGDDFYDEDRSTSKSVRLSQGRRALLRVSERKTEERRLDREAHGYLMIPEGVESSDDEGTSSSYQLSAVDETLAFDDIADALQIGDNSTIGEERALSSSDIEETQEGNTQNSARRRKKGSRKKVSRARQLKGMRSMALTADEDEERMKRFEDAYTIMCTVRKSEDNVIKASKRWSRASNIPIAVSIDGRVYADMQRSPTMRHAMASRRYGNEVVGAELNGKTLADRGASWMMHLPKQDRSRPVKFFGHSYPTNGIDVNQVATNITGISPTKKKLMEIVDRFQLRNQPSPSLHNVPQSQECDQDGVEEISSNRKFRPKELFRNEESVQPKQSFIQNLSLGVNVQNIKHRISQGFVAEEVVEEYTDSTYTEESDPIYEQKIQKIAAQVMSNNSVIDTDDQSGISESEDALQSARIGSLMMSPTIISKRLNQAVEAVRLGHWDQVGYLILANPWLAEMPDVTSNQYLLHTLAYYGEGTISETEEFYEPAPRKLNADLMKMSSAVQKFDSFGNLPLHRAAEAGNKEMTTRLAKIFPGGASVMNTDGQLPLHLAVLACANKMVKSPLTVVSNILALNPHALAIADNDGNLPLHLAAAYLSGELGSEVVHLLVDEADKHGGNLRFPKSIRTLDNADDTMSSVDSVFDDSDEIAEEEQTVLSVRNALGWNPIVTAIQMAADFEILDALLTRPGVEPIAFARDKNGETILHTSMTKKYCDPSSVISILKSFPDLVIFSDESGALPIEIACLRELPTEVIFAIALLDLPIDPDDDEILVREGFGGSWWYLNCDCDDNYVHVVSEMLLMCDDYEQKRALCFLTDRQGNSIMSRATPKCKYELRKALRFNGRYEFVGRPITGPDGVKVFEALDFGPDDDPKEEGSQVRIKYYGDRETFTRAVSLAIVQRSAVPYSCVSHILIVFSFIFSGKDFTTHKIRRRSVREYPVL
jgi:ankyrin repeat protein